MRNLSQTILSNVNGALNQASPAINCGQIYAVSVQASFTGGTLGGTLRLMASNDLASPTNWSQIATASVSAGALTMIPITQTSYQFVQVTWAPSAGTGTMTVNINSQGF